jgi:hypothetical protein
MKPAALVVAALIAGCQKSEPPAPPPPPPTEALVTAMRDYCRIPTLPPDKQREALKLWGWQTAGDKQVGPIWTAAVKKHAPSIAMIRAAADAAVGPGNCKQLDALKAAP